MSKKNAENQTSMAQDMIALLSCGGGIYTIYMIYGLLHERIYHTARGDNGDKYSGSLSLVVIQSFVHMLLAMLALAISKPPKSTAPASSYAQIGFSYIGAMLASNAALSYVSYPTQVLGKSCKLIPVMLMRIFFVGQKYTLKEYMAVLLITLGIVVFMLNKSSSKSSGVENSWKGVALLCVSLLMDGATGPKQDAIRKTHKPSVYEMMLWINVFAVIFGTIGLFVGGEIWSTLSFFEAHPEVVYEIFGFGVLSAAGQLTILKTIFRFDSLVMTTLTTTRKFFTIMASVVYYGHNILPMQWVGVVIVFVGLGVDMQNKYAKKQLQKKAKAEGKAE